MELTVYEKNNGELTNQNPEVCIEKEKRRRNYGLIKAIMIFLFILTLCCPYFALISMTYADKLNPQHGFSITKLTWLCWCWLPIPVLSVILGFKYKKTGLKCKKNIIGGFIIGAFLMIYGSFYWFPTFEQDYSKIDAYRSIVNADLPDSGQLEIQEWGKYSDDDKTEYVIINAYYDRENVDDLERSIENNSHWIPCEAIRTDLKVLIPSTIKSDRDAYYLIYNKTTGEYNALPASTGSYEIYAMKYDKSAKQLEIHCFLMDYRT